MIKWIKTQLRLYALTWVLGAFALTLFLIHADSAGLVFVGFVFATFLATFQEQRTDARRANEGERQGFDEVRRLLLMIRTTPGEPSSELVASVVNALIYHHGIRKESELEALTMQLRAAGLVASEPHKRWLKDLIDEVTVARDRIPSG